MIEVSPWTRIICSKTELPNFFLIFTDFLAECPKKEKGKQSDSSISRNQEMSRSFLDIP